MCQYGRTQALLIDQGTGQVRMAGGLKVESNSQETDTELTDTSKERRRWLKEWKALNDIYGYDKT